MTYQIPQQLAYKEKILFGLTFEQLGIAGIFLVPALLLLLKTAFPLAVRVTLALFPVIIGCLFMFTNLWQELKAITKWLRYRSIGLYNEGELDRKMQEFLPIKEIKETIELTKGEVAIIQVTPTNFSIRNDKEQEILTSSFRKFLNSLDFPVQIVIATDSLNLDHYLSTLEEESKAEYSELLQDFKEHMQSMISSKGLLNRIFYLVIPEQEKTGLEIQLSICQKLLTNLNLKHKVLKQEELISTVASFFHNQYQDKSTDKNHLFDAIAPEKILNKSTELETESQFIRTIAVKGYPRTVEQGFLDKLITINGNIDISLHIEPYSIEEQMIMLNKELQKQRGDLWTMQRKEIINPALEIQYEDTRKVLEELQKGNEKLFNISLYVSCKAKTKEELDLLTKKVESELNSLLMIPARPRYRQHEAYKSVLPLGIDSLKVQRNITTGALSAFFPFTSQFLQVDNSGILLGLNKNNIPIIKDIFKLYNANGVVLASSGGGKSYFTKLMISRLLQRNTRVMVIDPQAEYIDLVKQFNGQLVTISKESKTIINPLDLMGHDFDEKKLTLLELLPIMLGDMSEVQKAVMDRALTATYEAAGITMHRRTWRKTPPILGDLLKQLKQMSKTASKVEMETYRSLINRLEMYVSGVFGFLNKQTKLNFENRFVCFNIGDMPNQVKPTVMFLILDYVYQKMQAGLERKFLVCDEAWSLLQRTEDEGYIFRIVKTARKFNLGLLLITQDVGDLVKSDAGKALLNNSEYTLLLRQKPSIIEQVQKTFHLSDLERERLLTATTGKGVLIIGNEHSEINIIASPEEHSVITTNADEMLAKQKPKVVETFDKATLDYKKGYFRRRELTENQVEELLHAGYQRSRHIGLYGGRQEEYLLKPSKHESLEHFFVIKAIEEYVKKYADNVELFATKGADLVFKIGKKRVAIEVETGTNLSGQPKVFEKKIKAIKKEFGKNWFIVVTNWKFKRDYEKFGETFVKKEIPAVLKKRYFS